MGAEIAFPFCLMSISVQALICMMILLGSCYSTWGLAGMRYYGLEILLLLASIYPNWVFLSIEVWLVLTPANLLENGMAWLGSVGLRLLGQPATAHGIYLTLPAGSVKVASGCNGFDMAFVIVCFSLLLGLFMQQSWLKITQVALIGSVLALMFNIPRIMLLAIAATHWGQQAFDFWHGPIGGQLFSTILLSVYYYVAMALFTQRPAKNTQ